jgi:exosortase C (VPDSG-CTERM-specific)
MNSSDGQLVTNPSVEEPNPQTPGTTPISASPRRRLTGLAVVSALVLLCFAKPLYSLVRFASQDDMYSYILLVPFVSVYLISFNRHNLSWDPQPTLGAALVPSLAGLGILGGYYLAVGSGWHFQLEDYLCVMMLSLVFLLQACALVFAGWRMMRRVTFPVAFLFFLAPLPAVMFHSIESLLQNGSADVADWLLSLSGMPVLRQGTFFQLPAFSLEVAPECSGIHSTFVLFITSLLAGYVFLRSPWRRTALALAVIPLALLRNGFRVFVIAQLCVNVSPEMIHSYIHRKGGPIFFVLFLIPFFLVLCVLRKWDIKSYPASADQPIPPSKQS